MRTAGQARDDLCRGPRRQSSMFFIRTAVGGKPGDTTEAAGSLPIVSAIVFLDGEGIGNFASNEFGDVGRRFRKDLVRTPARMRSFLASTESAARSAIGRRASNRPARGGRDGPGPCDREQGRGRLPARRPVRKAPIADSRMG